MPGQPAGLACTAPAEPVCRAGGRKPAAAKKDDVCIIQVESEGYNKSKVITPIIAMKGGSDYQQYVDILVPHKATFKLIQGEGPIHLVGSHCVNFYGYRLVSNPASFHGLY